MALGEPEIERYARQLLLPALGEQGQERLGAAQVRVVGSSPVAGPAMLYLAEAGLGRILVDLWGRGGPGDGAAWLFGPTGMGRSRADVAVDALRRVNRLIEVRRQGPDDRPTVILICSDAQDERLALAEEARRSGLACLVAEASGDGGRLLVLPAGGPCYACAGDPAPDEVPSAGGVAALGALCALELVLLVAGASQEPRARQITLAGGLPSTTALARRADCACAQPPTSGAESAGPT
jgi:adenylyltransferase/sulfurtransferase